MRTTTRKRQPVMNPKRWLAVILVALVAVIAVIIMYYNAIQQPFWNSENPIRKQAKEAAGLTEVSSVTKQVWDTTSWIVKGKNDANEEIYVWLIGPDKTVQTVKAAEATDKAAIKQALLQKKPDAAIKRIQPGTLNGQLVWEVFYSQGNNPEKYSYDFYDFRSGTYVTEYHLPAKTAS
ncbi:cell wall elongation regulator TseB-like domain-containing protein [Paenibacillus sp. MMO-177]|uniref:cell wall elongation regulator TseB-like domain-containing protein n=1 Tax=Paenibacillus sp. MMO-177 TaxID=3081289 RepID=UPI00301B2A59